MRHLIYLSQATDEYRDANQFLPGSRDYNHLHDLTGYLMSYRRNFMQLLEGPDQAVTDVMIKITADRRHHNITIILDEPGQERIFNDWSMAYSNQDVAASLPAETLAMFERLLVIQKQAPHQTRTICGGLLSEFRKSLG